MYGVSGGRMQFLYLYGPNGWGYQVIGTCSDTSLCGDNIVNYDMCTQGVAGHCDADLPNPNPSYSYDDDAGAAIFEKPVVEEMLAW